MSKPIEILVGTTAGNTEYLASELELKLQEQGFTTQFHDYPKWDDLNLNASFLFCIATHGAGEYAESIAELMEHIEQLKPDLTHMHYALVAIGDSSYDTYCSAGDEANKLLQSLGATTLCPMLKIDMMTALEPEAIALEWLQQINWP